MLFKKCNVTQVFILLGFLGASQASAWSTFKVPLKSSVITNVIQFNDTSAPLKNAALKLVVSVEAGDNETFSSVLVDTGSGILWVGGEERYVPGPYTRVINETFDIGYGIGGASGIAYLDRVTIGDATVTSQIIGAANNTQNFALVEPIDGILGLCPPGYNQREISGYNTTPTFVENLFSEGVTEKPIWGLYVSPLNESGVPEGTGEITFGGVDMNLINGNITWVPRNASPGKYYNCNVSSITWGNSALTSGPSFALSDSGLLPLEFPTDAFFAIYDDVPGASIDGSSALEGLLIFPSNMTIDTLPTITIGIADLNISIPASRYTVPKSLYSSLNITNDGSIHTWIAPSKPDTFGLGQKFLENVYTAYNFENDLLGFANVA